jgi:hydroxyacylglutathione hydrolase
MKVTPLPALDDNYVYGIEDPACGRAALVDPAEAAPAVAWLRRRGLELETVLLTHHHRDHVGGVGEVLRRWPAARLVGARLDRHRLPPLDREVGDGDELEVANRRARVIGVPGHTAGHVAYFVPDPDDEDTGDLFSGDTLFGATIGFVFEGTLEQMYESVRRLRELPKRTRIWCGHEYTLRTVGESARFEPDHAALAARLAHLEANVGQPTVPLTLEEELRLNPFLRWDDPTLCARLGTPPGLETFARLYDLL